MIHTNKGQEAEAFHAGDAFRDIVTFIDFLKNDIPHSGRELALAKTKLEECVMWINAACDKK